MEAPACAELLCSPSCWSCINQRFIDFHSFDFCAAAFVRRMAAFVLVIPSLLIRSVLSGVSRRRNMFSSFSILPPLMNTGSNCALAL